MNLGLYALALLTGCGENQNDTNSPDTSIPDTTDTGIDTNPDTGDTGDTGHTGNCTTGEEVDVYVDSDMDGYVAEFKTLTMCVDDVLPDGYRYVDDPDLKTKNIDEEDCNDNMPEVHPEAEEVCNNGIDDNCNNDASECEWDSNMVLGADADQSIYSNNESDNCGVSVSTIGDNNGDGYDDVIVGCTGAGDGGRASLLYGSENGLTGSYEDDWVGYNQTGAGFGAIVSGGVDVTGDGHPDYGVSALQLDVMYDNANNGAAFTFDGAESVGEEHLTVYNDSEQDDEIYSGYLGANFQLIPDFDGDGIGEKVYTENYNITGGSYYAQGAVYMCSSKNMVTGTESVYDACDLQVVGENFRSALIYATAGDFDGDGLSDLVMGSPGSLAASDVDEDYWYASGTGEVGILYGQDKSSVAENESISMDTTELDATIYPNTSETYAFGLGLEAGDLTGDGVDDLAVYAPYYNDTSDPAGQTGAIYIYRRAGRWH